MNDLISRSALIDSFYASLNTGKESFPIEVVIEFVKAVKEQSTVEAPLSDCVGDCKSCWKTKLVNAPTVEPVRGEWEVVHGVMTPGGDPLLRCPVCRSEESYHMGGIEMPQHWNFCPNCGADMRGEKNEK